MTTIGPSSPSTKFIAFITSVMRNTVSTKFKIGDPMTLIAIASWDSKAQRDAMEGQHAPDVAAIIKSAAPFCEIRPLGEFEDPEWVVEPGNGGNTE